MARYFFNICNATREPDDEGMELPDISAARRQAVVYAGAVMESEPTILWNGSEFRVEETDEGENLLFTILALSVDAPRTADID